MPVKTNFKVQNLVEAKAGDLVRLDDSSQFALAFVLGRTENNDFPVLTLQPVIPQLGSMVVMLPSLGKVCNFGSDWVLEPLDIGESAIGNDNYRNVCGVVFVAESRMTMPVKHPNNPTRVYHLNLETWGFEPSSDASAPIPAWQLWANADERSRDGGKPLLTFDTRKK